MKIAFSVRPVTHVAQASINVTSPKLAWIGTIAARQPYVAFSQHRHTKKLYIPVRWKCFINNSGNHMRRIQLTWRSQKQTATRTVPLWPGPARNARNKSLESVDLPSCENQTQPKIRSQHMEWCKRGIECEPISRRCVSSSDKAGTIILLKIQ